MILLQSISLFTIAIVLGAEIPIPPEEDPDIKEPPKDGKCRALAMRGGGTKGAYEVGALKAMTDMLIPIEYAYDVIVGVSCGGINAGMMSTYSRGQEKLVVDFLWEAWSNMPVTDFWSNWKLGPLGGLWRSSFLNSSKMVSLINDIIGGRSIKRGLALQSVDLNTGQTVIYDHTMPTEFLPEAIAASASVPGAFKPQYIEGQTMVDGLVLSNLDLSEAITQCQDKGFKDEDIIVDVILCFDQVVEWEDWPKDFIKWKNAYQLYKRKEYFRYFYYYYEDITRVVKGYPNVHFRHMISPKQKMGGYYIPLFDDIEVQKGFLVKGYDDTKMILEQYFKEFPNHSVNTTRPKVQSNHHQAAVQSYPNDVPLDFSFESIRQSIAADKKQESKFPSI